MTAPKNVLKAIAQNFVPNLSQSELAVAAPGIGPGFWAGASSAIDVDGDIYISYRVRQPIELGRGQGIVVARSRDGIHFETLCTITKEAMNAESLERPTLIRMSKGTWRIYISCATFGTKHWRVELLEADDPAKFSAETRQVILPGDREWGVKDTVIQFHDGIWHLWATMHPLNIKDAEDRMQSNHAISNDGIVWQWQGTALRAGESGKWDSRGRRITAIRFTPYGVIAYYDGRANASENYDERTGFAIGTSPDKFTSISRVKPIAQSPDGKALRYLDIVPLNKGGYRLYYEAACLDGAHELRTELREEWL
jgi:hypothetical protein